MDTRIAVAKAMGLQDDVLSMWQDIQPSRLKDDDEWARFDLDGPIVGSDMDNYFADGEGFVTPAQLRAFLSDNADKNIEININSPGGNVFSANAMISDLMRHKKAIRIVVSGACFSAAVDFLTIPDSERIAMPGSMLMIHNAFTFAMGDAVQLQKVVDRLIKMNEVCADRFADATKLKRDKLIEMMNAETWFDEKEALEAGFVDKIYEADSKDDDNAERLANADDTMVESEKNAIVRIASMVGLSIKEGI